MAYEKKFNNLVNFSLGSMEFIVGYMQFETLKGFSEYVPLNNETLLSRCPAYYIFRCLVNYKKTKEMVVRNRSFFATEFSFFLTVDHPPGFYSQR